MLDKVLLPYWHKKKVSGSGRIKKNRKTKRGGNQCHTILAKSALAGSVTPRNRKAHEVGGKEGKGRRGKSREAARG